MNETEATAATDEATANKTDAEQDIETLLSSYDEKVEPKAAPDREPDEPKPADGDMGLVVDYVKTQIARDQAAELENTAKEIKALNEAQLGNFPDKVIRNLIRAEAADDPRIEKVYLDRHKNPGAWKSLSKDLATRIGQELGQRPDPQLTRDRDAAAASVRGMSHKAPAEETSEAALKLARNSGSMSDAEWRAAKKELLGGR